ncbi:MAG: DNA-directed RNA polymerase [Candidatus Aenigmarchaeota archaeon]|nr:DNA-directed RNA polymerase [Candidatus Aenigmarchaeota archaeon]
MFKILNVTDTVRVQPKYFGMKIEDAITESLREQVEGKLDPDIGVFLVVTNVLEFGKGTIEPGDPSIHYPATFEVLTYIPEEREVVYGVVIDIAEFGAFVRIGPMDAMVHVSQILNDRVVYDQKNSMFTGKRTGKKLQIGDVVRARIVSVSLGKTRTKLGLTMRQPMLGSLKWIEAEKKKRKKPATRKGSKGGKAK